jgi:hypothetical protein
MKNLFHCHPSTSVILSEVAAATESKDPYAARSLAAGTFFDGATSPPRAKSRRICGSCPQHSCGAKENDQFASGGKEKAKIDL